MAEVPNYVYLMSSATSGGWLAGVVYKGEVTSVDGKDVIRYTIEIPGREPTISDVDYTDVLKGYVQNGLPIKGRTYSQEFLKELYEYQNDGDSGQLLTDLLALKKIGGRPRKRTKRKSRR